MNGKLLTVVETPAFLAATKRMFSDEERAAIIGMVAAAPLSGVSLGGGLRKFRVGLAGRGKSGGARLVYLFAGDDVPLFLLTAFAKNERANLSEREQATLMSLAKDLVQAYRRRR